MMVAVAMAVAAMAAVMLFVHYIALGWLLGWRGLRHAIIIFQDTPV